MSQPTPPSLLKAKLQTIGMAGAAVAVTAGLTMAVTSAPEVIAASDHAIAVKQMQEDVNLAAASIGVYPVGPGAQIMRTLGMGTPQGALNTLGTIAGLIPGSTGDSLKATLQSIADLLEAAQTGVTILPEHTIPNVGIPGTDHELALWDGIKLAIPEIAVPQLGPAGTYDQVAGMHGDAGTQLLLTGVKTLLANGPLVTELVNLGFLPAGVAQILNVLANVPLNVPGEKYSINILGLPVSAYWSDATALAILPTWGLGGTNAAITEPFFLKDDAFKQTAVLVVAMRNSSRPGGGIAALMNPLSSLVGINLSNVDGRTGNGNTTVWDITAAYDLMSDAPSTILNPVAWANSAAGAVAPTYLLPKNLDNLGALLGDVLDGTLLKTELGADGNLYITYNSGNLPLLQPFQAVPQLMSLIPGFKISTPVSSSFEDVLTQMVAMGYQDVNLTGDAPGQTPVFERGFDAAGTQAKFWTSPVSFTDGLQAPQALFDALIGNGTDSGLTGNLLNPGDQKLTLFSNTALGDALYDNGLTTAVAGFLKQALLSLKTQLNPIFDAVDSNSVVRQLAGALDQATTQVNGLIDQGGGAIKGLDIDLATPLMDGNRAFNKLTNQIGSAISGAAQSSGSSGLVNSLNAAGATGSNNLLGGTANRGVQPQSIVTASAEQNQIGSGTPTTKLTPKDFLSNLGTGNNARAIAQALKGGSGSGATSGLQRQLAKTETDLAGAQQRTKAAADKLGQDVKGAVQEAGKKVEQGFNNGLTKVGIKQDKKGSDDSPSKVAPKKETKTEHKTDHAA